MNADEAFKKFKEQYSSTPRVMAIEENDFGGDDITVLYYNKYDINPPLTMTSYEGYQVDVRGIMELLRTFETLYDLHVVNDPNTWDQVDVPFAWHYKKISARIAKYELENM